MTSPRIRKQVYELTAEDLARYPVWEFALDEETEEGQDEATVRPYQYDGLLDPSDSGLVVAARFLIADGTAYSGFLTPPPTRGDIDLGLIQPSIVTSAGNVWFWCGIRQPTAKEISESYARLGKATGDLVFPISFESSVPLKGGSIQGVVPGFLGYEDCKVGRVRVWK